MSLSFQAHGSWPIQLESPVPKALLGEPTSTQIDALAQSDSSLLLFECKFTESAGGACSQTRPLPSGAHQGLIQCTGNYEEQLNPVNQRRARCALTGKGIKYWDLIPEVIDVDPNTDHRPCPFSDRSAHGSWFQWMRNLVAALALSQSHHLPSAFVVVYVDGPFPIASYVNGQDWRRLEAAVAAHSIPLRAISYQRLLSLAQQVSAPTDRRALEELGVWMGDKFKAAIGAPGVPPTTSVEREP
jgi:hypothetical protein